MLLLGAGSLQLKRCTNSHLTGVLQKRGLDTEETQGTGPRDTEAKAEVTLPPPPPAKEDPRTVWTTGSKEEGRRGSFLEPQTVCRRAGVLTSDFQSPALSQNTFLLV